MASDDMGMDSSSERASMEDSEGFDMLSFFVVLYKGKILLIANLLFFLSAAVIYSVVTEDHYTFSTTIQIGSKAIQIGAKSIGTVVGAKGREAPIYEILIEEPQNVLIKLREGFIPLVLQEAGATDFRITARIPSKSEIIILESECLAEDDKTITELLKKIAGHVIEDHDRTINVRRKSLKSRLEEKKAELAKLNMASGGIQALMQLNVGFLKTLLEELSKKKSGVVPGTGDEKRSSSDFMNELVIQLKTEHDLEILQEKKRIERQMQSLEIEAEGLQSTKMALQPIRLPEPTKPNRPLIIIFGALTGLIVGICLCYLTEVHAIVKEKVESNV